MAKLTELGQVMHEEHFRILVLICGFENRVTGPSADRPIDPNIEGDRAQLEELTSGLDAMVAHNAFEETVLFPLMGDGDEGELAVLLAQEHVVIGPLAKRVRALAVDILEHGIGPSRWAEFREATMDLASHLLLHLQKEEMAVVQQLRSLLDRDVDHTLALQYAAECRCTLENAAGKAAERRSGRNVATA